MWIGCNLVWSTFIWSQNTILVIFSLTYLYWPLFTFIWLYLGLITLIWAYLPWFYHMCHIHPIYVFFYWDCTQILEQSDHYLWRYCISKIWGDTSVVSECSLGVNLVIDNYFDVASDTLPLYTILKQSDHYLRILHFEDLGDTSVVSECSLGVNLVIENCFDVASDTLPLYKIWKQSDHYFLGVKVSSANAVWVLI